MNPIVFYNVVRELRRHRNLQKSYWLKMVILGAIIQLFCVYRVYFTWAFVPLQDKENERYAGPQFLFVSYIILCEVGAQFILIFGLITYT